ncbi:hypothetical protein [Rugosimonospora africana]|uniref:Uncharacterized protein n=1 Tax=Rugosimonospora africana TaxID=556532 RepID=A0A8J3VV43_9ACTN|nr:hypothetical protein [Rugosimonospora africana]GIH19885.1 hypothetical protein Raf01_80570 [Rugosimonospora africana]
MKMLWRRRVLTVALSLAAAAGGLLLSGTAHAQAVTTGSLSFSGDSGDYISQGKSYSYSTGNGDGLSVSSSSGSAVSVSINAYNGDTWTLDVDAPGTKVLAPGTYASAHRYPFNGTGPGLDLSGDGRGCNELTGSFTVIKAVFGPNGYVQTFDATFEQHCEGGTPAAHGEIRISNPAPPKHTTPTSPHTTPTRPHATTAGPHATPTGSHAASTGPSAAPTGSPSATVAGGGDNAAGVTDAPATPAAEGNALRPLIGLGAVVAAWVGFGVVALIVGVVLGARFR